MPVLAHVAKDFQCRRFGNGQAEQPRAPSQRDGERAQAAEGVADQMHRATRAADHRFKRLRLVSHAGIADAAAFLGAAISEQARGDDAIILPLRHHRPPGGAGAA